MAGNHPHVQYAYLAALDDLQLLPTAPARAPAPGALLAWPNPSAGGPVQLSWPATAGATVLEVRDALGRLVRSQPLAPAQATATLDLAELPRGLYLAQVRGSGPRLTCRLVLE